MANEQQPLTKKQKLNRLYYENNKVTLNSKKCCLHFNIEVPKENEVRLVKIKENIYKIKAQLKLEGSMMANVDVIEALPDNWLTNHPPT